MKKTMILLLAAMLLLTACAEGFGFTFSHDIAWGMTQAQVLEAEGNPKYDKDVEAGLTQIEIDDLVYEGAPCDIEYAFDGDSLTGICVEFDDDAHAVTYDQLISSLSQKYGEPASNGPDSSFGEDINIAIWALSDGTTIMLAEELDDGDLQLLFLNYMD